MEGGICNKAIEITINIYYHWFTVRINFSEQYRIEGEIDEMRSPFPEKTYHPFVMIYHNHSTHLGRLRYSTQHWLYTYADIEMLLQYSNQHNDMDNSIEVYSIVVYVSGPSKSF